ncbi:zinc finger protein 852-like isoform X2 [Cylas formicarius]|uniref:zinc finger protein 852-like isoform X2 n=1 Tax=Cylas formicarius TaxID=197179 RepID=UPI0029588BD7|nr:zinc finger protein 852-like isoform X2 [Cylas formicarius]
MNNLQSLIAEPCSDGIIKDEIIDNDILLFSQYESLSDPNEELQILQQFEDNPSTIVYHDNPLELPSDHGSFPTTPTPANLLVRSDPTGSKSNKSSGGSHLANGKPSKVFECGICGKQFGHQYTLMRHLPTHTDERKFHCLTCGKSFRQMCTLSQHRAIHSSARPYVCEICHKNFNRVSTLISHRKTHTGQKPHRCHLCNKSFHQKGKKGLRHLFRAHINHILRNSGNLRNHIFTHTNERPYKCDVCSKGFNQMSNLMCHKFKVHHQDNVIPKYECKVCGEEFSKRINLRHHEQRQHGLTPLPSSGSSAFNQSHTIFVDPIQTEAMRRALESNRTPFALLRPLSGIPVLVRVLPAGDKQMLVPATEEDLEEYGQISVTPKVEADQEDQGTGTVVQIKLPVVATVIQKGETDFLTGVPGSMPHDSLNSVKILNEDAGSSELPVCEPVNPCGNVNIENADFIFLDSVTC